MKKSSKKEPTLREVRDQLTESVEGLARAVQQGFSSSKKDLDEGLNSLENRMSKKFEAIEFRIGMHATQWDKELEKLHELVGEHEKRINTIEDRMVRK